MKGAIYISAFLRQLECRTKVSRLQGYRKKIESWLLTLLHRCWNHCQKRAYIMKQMNPEEVGKNGVIGKRQTKQSALAWRGRRTQMKGENWRGRDAL
ncbi:hypothetical protein KP509_11G029900 [Ceratopteris richardii]|uniref:Uncharacterized protein n=1 Tax=Ceratopteris richardii TaxID=49495 RepID=A0A8T2TU11_CERRI|nr:hypothetical protein KP509_11G029900 [Ceratopteris richardii]